MLASEVEVKAASEVLRDTPGRRSFGCAVYSVCRLGLEAEAEGARKECVKDGFRRKVRFGVVVVVVEIIAQAVARSGRCCTLG